MACQDATVAKAARLQHKQQLGQKSFQLVDCATLDCCGLKATLNQAPPHGLQPTCMFARTICENHLQEPFVRTICEYLSKQNALFEIAFECHMACCVMASMRVCAVASMGVCADVG